MISRAVSGLRRWVSLAGIFKNSLLSVIPCSAPLDWDSNKNWGDKLNPFLINVFASRFAYNPRFSVLSRSNTRLMMIGRILRRADQNCVVWGAGFMSSSERVNSQPKKICAVRGPLSRDVLLGSGVDCPDVYGDPAILLPRIVKGSKIKKYKYGVVPHYIDKGNSWVLDQKKIYGNQCLIIDVQNCGIRRFVRLVSSCEIVFSSSLHGLICADAYWVKNVRLVLGDLVGGGDFKFQDYRAGVHGVGHVPVRVSDSSLSLEKLAHLASYANVEVAANALWEVRPFRSWSDKRRKRF